MIATLFLVALAPSLLIQDAQPSGGELRPEQAAFDVQHVTLEITVDPEAKTIEGTMHMNARVLERTRRIELDLDYPLAVRRVQLGDTEVKFKRDGGVIEIPCRPALEPGNDFGLLVEYGGTPRVAKRAPWDGGFTWAQAPDGQPWFATTCQGEGADLWWPCKDHPSDKPESFDLIVKVPTGLVVASNGILLGVDEHEDGTQFHWHTDSPIANYNVALNVGPFQVLSDSYESVGGETVPIQFYVLPEDADRARGLLPEIEEHLAFFEQLLGPYPFRHEKYGIVQTPHLGMEHQTIIAYGYDFQKDKRFGYDWLHHHELSHEWWGNLVSCRDWKDMWIHEGFGTYCQSLYVEKHHGREGYVTQMREHMRGLANASPIAPREATDSKAIYFGPKGQSSNDIYYKGSAVLHALRWVIGDEAFFASLKEMCYPTEASRSATDGTQVRFVDTDDYIEIVERLHDDDLDWFFEVYLRNAALPKLEVKQSRGRLDLRWETEEKAPFPLAVPVRVNGELRRVECPKGKGRLKFDAGAKIELDPENWLLRVDGLK